MIIIKRGDNYYILITIFFVRRYDFSNLTGIWKGSCRKNQIKQFSKRLWQYFFECFENLVGMLFIPIDLLSLKSLSRSSTSSAVIGVRKKFFSLGFLNDSWNWDSVLSILASIFVVIELKKCLNSLATLFFFSYKCMIYFLR